VSDYATFACPIWEADALSPHSKEALPLLLPWGCAAKGANLKIVIGGLLAEGKMVVRSWGLSVHVGQLSADACFPPQERMTLIQFMF